MSLACFILHRALQHAVDFGREGRNFCIGVVGAGVAQSVQQAPIVRTNRTAHTGVAVALVILAACDSGPSLIGVEELSREDTANTTSQHRIFIATTRVKSDDEGVFYSGDRAGRMGFASVDVSIPKDRETGELSLPRTPPVDPKKHFVLRNPVRLADADAFTQEINREVDARASDEKSAMIFIHGYNTNTTEAIARFAQLVEDTGYRGVPILFTWPSSRRVADYVADINSAAFSRDAVAHMPLLLARTRLTNYDIVAHSMGNFLAMEAMRTLSLRGHVDRLGRLNTVVLAAPDIDVDLFAAQLASVPDPLLDRMIVLVSRDDKALLASRRVAGNHPRLGAVDPEAIGELGVKVIDLTEIDDASSINHSKFAESPEIVQLLGERLADSDALSTQTSIGGLLLQRTGEVVSVAQVP